MSTAEYAVGMVAAVAIAGILYKIVTSSVVKDGLLALVMRALEMGE